MSTGRPPLPCSSSRCASGDLAKPSLSNSRRLSFFLRIDMGIENVCAQPGGLHHVAHAYIFKSLLTEQSGSLLYNPLMFCGSPFDGTRILVSAQSSMRDQAAIPHAVQVAPVSTALITPEKSDMNPIPASGFGNCMQGLVDVTHEMNDEFQCFRPVFPACLFVR